MTFPSLWHQRQLGLQAIRQFFVERGYLEIDTPALVVSPGTEVHLRYFATEWRDISGNPTTLYLRSSPELHMKQAVAQGLERVFQLAKCFRNQGEIGPWHHPEFTMLEWYEVDLGFDAAMAQTETLVKTVAAALPSAKKLPNTFKRISVKEAFLQFAKIELNDNDPGLAGVARSQGVLSVRADDDFETAFFKVLLEKVEPALARMDAVFLYDYPASMAALARVEDEVAKRFELYLEGIELCNAFWELSDAAANRTRIEEANSRRRELGYEIPPVDEEFLEALSKGLPHCTGNALGVDRLIAVLLGEKNLDGIVPFRRGIFGGSSSPL